ncbi:MAG: glycosyl hydrolase family 28-related protein, partial [Bacteroidota bacterium]|nr:glycosyl hydrolase family 28-related protein [Bacteroidota bacterium]
MKTNYYAIFISLLAILFGINTVHAGTNIPLPVIPSTQFLATNYGAKTTNTDNASYINAAITTANAAGGGTVVLPAGTFLSGPITMKSNVNLYLAAGDTLRILPYGSGNGTVAGTYPNNGTTDQYNPFIYGKSLSNIEVSGSGVIDGQGSAWWTA